MLVPLILSGGSGTRLWPLSRPDRPKQLLPLFGERSLLQQTVLRARAVGAQVEVGPPVVVCGVRHVDAITAQLAEIGVTEARFVIEPEGRNTAPAIATVAHLLADEDPTLLVLPSDHLVEDVDAFAEAVGAAAETAAAGYLVTFGIVPTRPETGYGYIERGRRLADVPAFRVRRFVEKPDRETAARYVASGEHLWNSGMFVFRARPFLVELQAHAPEVASCAAAAVPGGSWPVRLIPEAFAACPSVSVDVAVMERTERAAVVPLDAGWSDVGSWAAVWERSPKDGNGNATVGDVVMLDGSGTYVRSEGRLVGVVGVEDLIVVETEDAVLVCHRDRAQDVRRLVEELRSRGRPEAG